jgi:hypothetical protein
VIWSVGVVVSVVVDVVVFVGVVIVVVSIVVDSIVVETEVDAGVSIGAGVIGVGDAVCVVSIGSVCTIHQSKLISSDNGSAILIVNFPFS